MEQSGNPPARFPLGDGRELRLQENGRGLELRIFSPLAPTMPTVMSGTKLAVPVTREALAAMAEAFARREVSA